MTTKNAAPKGHLGAEGPPTKEACPRCAEPMSSHRPDPGCIYLGWTNYETWAVNLWMSNDEGSYHYWQDEARAAIGSRSPRLYTSETREQIATRVLADAMKDAIAEQGAEEWMADQSSLYADLLNGALSAVNWYEIARRWIDDLAVPK